MTGHRSRLNALKNRIAGRARHWYNRDLAVSGSGSELTLTLRDPVTRQSRGSA